MMPTSEYPSAPQRALRIVGHVVLAAILGTALAAGFGFAVKYLWNHLMPGIFGLPAITYWQAVGLLLLARLLLGGFGGHGKHHGWMHRKHRGHGGCGRGRGRRKDRCGCATEGTTEPQA